MPEVVVEKLIECVDVARKLSRHQTLFAGEHGVIRIRLVGRMR